jgi:hypothetical protein
MLNLAGADYDFGHVLYVVLEECEHVRRSADADPALAATYLRDAATSKLAEIETVYRECGGTTPYWGELNHEILDTALPQYTPVAIEKNRLERASYDLWRGGDPVARLALGLGGLTLGGIMVKLPFIPIWEDGFAFLLATASFLYPDLKRFYYDHRHARFLNRLIVSADRYQNDRQLHVVTNAELDAALRPERHGSRAQQSAAQQAAADGRDSVVSDSPAPVPTAPHAIEPTSAEEAQVESQHPHEEKQPSRE